MADAKLNIIISAKDHTKGAIKGISGSLQNLGKVALAGAGIAAGAITAVGVGMYKLAEDAASLEGVQDAFEGITEAAGKNADAVLSAMQEQSAGMITNRDLMEGYNKAAQLVGDTFANELPEAMGFLGKVSAATGEDMGFMMNSLVTGIGRLSPMILDNLGIQVDLTKAYEDYAEANGLVVSEMTKTEQQAALMAQTMSMLEENTANMPDVAGSAAASFESFKVSLQNTKDEIGLALIPVVQPLMEQLGELAKTVLPPLVDMFKTHVVPVMIEFAGKLSELIDRLPEVRAQVVEVKDKIVEFIGKVKEVLKPVTDFIAANVETSDVLIALGVVVAAIVIPAIVSIVTAIGPLLLIFAALVAAVALIRKVWEEDWHGIRTFLEDVWNNSLKPALESLWEWLSVNVPKAIATISAWWNDTFIPTLEKVSTGISTVINWFTALGSKISAIASAIANFDWGTLKAIISESPPPMAVGIQMVVAEMKTLGSEIVRLKRISEGSNFVDDILGVGGSLSGLGSGFVRFMENPILGQLGRMRQMLSELDALKETGDLTIYQEETRLSLIERIYKEEQRIAQLKKQQENLSFLQEQMKLVSMIKEYGLDPGSILGGMKLGLDANLPDLIDAMTKAIQAIVEAANAELGVASPSKVFEKLGNFVMQGFAKGINASSSLPQRAFAQSAGQITRQNTNTSNYGNTYINNPAQMAVYLRQNDLARMRAIGNTI